MAMDDPFNLERFVVAQDSGGAYDRAVSELRGGRKASHWMWFVFPQVAGLGHSDTSRWFAISSLAEARAYLGHPMLGPRLIECARILTAKAGDRSDDVGGRSAEVGDRSAEQIFGSLDAQKLRSCMTLFARAAPDEPLFGQVLSRYFDGTADPATDQLL